MNVRTVTRWPLIAVAVLGLALAAGHLAILVAVGNTDASAAGPTAGSQVAEVAATLSAVLSGVMILAHRPGNWVGRGLVWAGLALFSVSGGLYAGFAHPRGLPLAVAVASAAAASYLPSLAALVVIFVSFPSDRPRSRVGWGLVGVASLAALVGAINEVLLPGTLFNLDRFGVANPIGVEALSGLPIYDISWAAINAAIAVGAITLLGRAVRSTGAERKQFLWLAPTTAVLVLSKAAEAAFDLPPVLSDVPIVFVPVSIAVAVIRYRLYDIDRVIKRTAAYAIVSVTLGGLFALLVVVPQALVFGQFESSPWTVGTVAVATLVVAALFNPLRLRVQSTIDRRFDRTHYDAQREMLELQDRFKDSTELDAMVDDLGEVVDRVLAPESLGLWLDEGPRR